MPSQFVSCLQGVKRILSSPAMNGRRHGPHYAIQGLPPHLTTIAKFPYALALGKLSELDAHIDHEAFLGFPFDIALKPARAHLLNRAFTLPRRGGAKAWTAELLVDLDEALGGRSYLHADFSFSGAWRTKTYRRIADLLWKLPSQHCATVDTLLSVWQSRGDLKPSQFASRAVALLVENDHGEGLPDYLSEHWAQSSNEFIVDFLQRAVDGLDCDFQENDYSYETEVAEEYAVRFAALFRAADPLASRFTDTQRLSMLQKMRNIPFQASNDVQCLFASWIHDLCGARTTTAAKTKIIREISQIMTHGFDL